MILQIIISNGILDLVTGILAKISLGTGIWAKFRLGTGIWYPPSRPSVNNEKSACLLESVDWARNKCRCPHGQRKLSVIFNEMPVVSENKRAATHILKGFVLYCK